MNDYEIAATFHATYYVQAESGSEAIELVRIEGGGKEVSILACTQLEDESEIKMVKIMACDRLS